MDTSSIDRIREIGAKHWKPLITIISAIMAGLNLFLPSVEGKRWLIFALLFAVIVIIRFPAVAVFITRLILGKPQLPTAAGRIFHGPRAYHRGDKLPGRQRQVDDFFALLQEKRFIILDGESGCGKSSFLNASILPKAEELFRVIECRIADDPVGKLNAAVLDQPYSPTLTDEWLTKQTEEPITRIRSDLLGALNKTAQKKTLLISIDQFEELFVTVPEAIRKQFLLLLKEATSSKVTILLSIRSDFLDLLLKLCRDVDPEQNVFDLGSYYTLCSFPKDLAVSVIKELLEPIGKQDPVIKQQFDAFSEDLARELLRPPRDSRVYRVDERTVLPVELQTVGVMLELTGLQYFSSKGLEKLGGKTGLLHRYLEDAKDYVWRKTGIFRDSALLVLRELISPARTKWAIASETIAKNTKLPRDKVDDILNALAEKYLVNKVPSDEGSVRFELMHEHLVQLLAEAPEPKLQKAQNAQQRLDFWVKQTHANLKAITQVKSRKLARWLRQRLVQPIPIFECVRLWGYSRTSEHRETISISFRGFLTKTLLFLIIFSSPFLLALFARYFLPSCHYPINPPLISYDPNQGYRFENTKTLGNTDSLFVFLALAGDGTKGAAFAYGVLEALRDTNIVWKGDNKRLIDEVDAISSVGGASFAAACYGLYRDDFFNNFKINFLARNIESDFVKFAIRPLNILKLNSRFYNMSDLLAEYLDEVIFEHATFGDLLKLGRRPFIIITATDDAYNIPFTFTQNTFDLIGSDLKGVPIARAVVAASTKSMYAPLSFYKFNLAQNFTAPTSVFAANDIESSPFRYAQAKAIRSYLEGVGISQVSLKGGGFSDKTALSAIIAAIASNDSTIQIRDKINSGSIEKLIVIYASSEDMLQVDSFQIEFLRTLLYQRKSEDNAIQSCKKLLLSQCPNAQIPPLSFLQQFEPYLIQVGLERIQNEKERARVRNIPASYSLTPYNADTLQRISRKLLEQSAVYNKLLVDLNNE